MPLAIFGIENSAINLGVTLAILCLVAIWLALIVFTFTDARRRIADPFLVGCATAASLFPFVGTMIYSILRPGEYLEDAHEREVEVRTSEVRLRHLEEHSCDKCGFPTESEFMRCPSCRTRLKEECPTCSKPVGMDWKLCPYCETALVAPPKRSSRSSSKSSSSKSSSSKSKSSKSAPRDSQPEETVAEGPRRSSRNSSKSSGRSSTSKSSRPAGNSVDGEAASSRSSSSRSTSSRPKSSSSRSKSSGSSSRSEETTKSPSARPSSSRSSGESSGRTPRSSRRKTAVPEDDTASKPINSGDSPAPGRTPESS